MDRRLSARPVGDCDGGPVRDEQSDHRLAFVAGATPDVGQSPFSVVWERHALRHGLPIAQVDAQQHQAPFAHLEPEEAGGIERDDAGVADVVVERPPITLDLNAHSGGEVDELRVTAMRPCGDRPFAFVEDAPRQ